MRHRPLIFRLAAVILLQGLIVPPLVHADSGYSGPLFDAHAHVIGTSGPVLYDEADNKAGSCQDAENLAAGLEYKEGRLRTGLGHGPFSQAGREWLDPVADWTRGR